MQFKGLNVSDIQYEIHVRTCHIEVQYLRGSHEVHLKEACLQRPFSGAVVLEGIQQERGTLLNHVHLHEHINNLKEKQDANCQNKTAHTLFRESKSESAEVNNTSA